MFKNALIILAGSVFLIVSIILAYLWFFEDYSPFRPVIGTPEPTPFVSSPASPTPFPTATIFPLPSDPGFVETPRDSGSGQPFFAPSRSPSPSCARPLP